MVNRPSISNLFKNFQSEMFIKLTGTRAFINHPGAKGAISEVEWINWLSDYLPKRYSVGSAFIIDSNNNISDQIDLVIYDNLYSPFVFNSNGIKYIPSESVYAVFEVKQELNSQNIDYAKEKIKSVRTLCRTSASIVHAGGKYIPKEPHHIIGGIITLTSNYDFTNSKVLIKNLSEGTEDESINFGLCLEQGGFLINEYVQFSEKENGLLFFFLTLLEELQSVGTVVAMDISEYKRHLKNI